MGERHRASRQLTPAYRVVARASGPSRRERIYAIVRSIPRGRVATYGQVAELAGCPGHARLVGYALAALDADSTVPWHRVVNARGEISLPSGGHPARAQRARLEAEGIAFQRGRILLDRYRWRGRALPGRSRIDSSARG